MRLLATSMMFHYLPLLCAATVSTAVGESALAQENTNQQGYPAAEPRTMPAPAIEEGIEVFLPIYSGRPSPRWHLKNGAEHDEVLALIEALEVREKALFDYARWNRFGYISFWLQLAPVEGLPRKIHVWRDQAYVVNAEGTPGYALGATELYNTLVAQAETRDQGAIFEKYREEQRQ